MVNNTLNTSCPCLYPEAPKMCPTTIMETKVNSLKELYDFFNGLYSFSYQDKNYRMTKLTAVPLCKESDGRLTGDGCNKRGHHYRLYTASS